MIKFSAVVLGKRGRPALALSPGGPLPGLPKLLPLRRTHPSYYRVYVHGEGKIQILKMLYALTIA